MVPQWYQVPFLLQSGGRDRPQAEVWAPCSADAALD